ncbi:hypothetical protein [Streptomyces lasiicapitis]|uniref:Uncharacterized protein n=1 Tax=Streptomyces lasiicapitis TaxID=1923961 RepID=A0ABQ2MW54_9ACTN|nr:hypothetical protein [Streptomyces lasiicapitis]GGO58901.1 hypothetical protein GCM10012286_79270 [Streptomyces lasiicapitis]
MERSTHQLNIGTTCQWPHPHARGHWQGLYLSHETRQSLENSGHRLVVSDLFGIQPRTAERWAAFAGANWSDYLAARQPPP